MAYIVAQRVPRRVRSSLLRERGMSLTEVAVALLLVGILVVAGVSSFRLANAGEQLDGWVRSMTFDISTGRQTAITQRTNVTITLTGSSYLIATSAGTLLRSTALPSDVSITTTCPASVCSFDRSGLPVAAGSISLASTSTGHSYTITIQPGTGSVSYR